jgi:nitrate/nitrite transport system substrate-binding protein
MKKREEQTTDSKATRTRQSRRDFARRACVAAAGTALFPNFTPVVYASDAPEKTNFKFGFIALTDCSPFVIAHEKGFFKKYGLASQAVKSANWAAVRDALIKGDVDCTHMLLGMPIASTIGSGGTKPVPMVAPWILNRNGQAISLKKEWAGKVAADPKALKTIVDEHNQKKRSKLTFAMTFPPGTHAMWLRYYLATGGIHPDRDVDLIVIPPPQMVQNMKVGKMDGFCVGEPWNERTIAERIGFTSITTQEIWKDHPEKVCAFTEEFASKYPKTVKAILKGLHEASVWLDDLGNRPEQCSIVSRDAYINCKAEQILPRLLGEMSYGDGRKVQDPNSMIFSSRNCNYPQPAYGKWWLTQLRRWGMIDSAPDYDSVAKRVMRSDIYEEAMSEMGVKHGGLDDSPWTMMDGVTFDPSGDCESYAKSFAIHNMKG